MPRRKQKIKYSRKFACKYLTPKGDISNSLQPLCFCPERELVLGLKAYVCQVCYLYSQTNRKTSDVYDESKKIAQKKIKEKEIVLDEYEIDQIKGEEEIDLSIDEFEQEEEHIPKFEKRKVGKEELEGEEMGMVECPFCAEMVDNLSSHIQTCEFAPEDVSIDDIIPAKTKKKRKHKKLAETKEESDKDKKICPYCGKEFIRLGRHIKACPRKPEDVDKAKE